MDEQEAVVRVRRSDWERVTERELLVGRLSLGSRLPQYLSGWCQLRSQGGGGGRGGGVLDDGNVDGRSRAGAVYLGVGHDGRCLVVWAMSRRGCFWEVVVSRTEVGLAVKFWVDGEGNGGVGQ